MALAVLLRGTKGSKCVDSCVATKHLSLTQTTDGKAREKKKIVARFNPLKRGLRSKFPWCGTRRTTEELFGNTLGTRDHTGESLRRCDETWANQSNGTTYTALPRLGSPLSSHTIPTGQLRRADRESATQWQHLFLRACPPNTWGSECNDTRHW